MQSAPKKKLKFSQLPDARTQSGQQFGIRRKMIPSNSTGALNLGTPPKVLILQNDLLCNPCTAINSFIAHDIEYQVVYAFHDNAFKLIHPLMFEAMIVLGGRAGVYEEPKWLKTEMVFITNALKLGIPILGICLGCQLLAECIGGDVFPGKKGVEIGYKKWKYTKDAKTTNDDFKENNQNERKRVRFGDLESNTNYNKNNNKNNIKVTKPLNNNDGHRMALRNIGRTKSSPYAQVGFDGSGIFGLSSIPDKKEMTPPTNKNNKKKYKNKKEHGNNNNIIIEDDDDIDFNEDEFDETDNDLDFDEDTFDEDFDEDEDKEEPIDPMVKLLQPKGDDKYIILFHGDTFSLPEKCKVSGQKVTLLATTSKYNTLFRVGNYSYGFQGHPELTYDMLRVWCKCWGDEFLNRWNGDLEKDVIQYARKYQDNIKFVGKNIFNIWCKDVVLAKNKQKLSALRTRSVQNLSISLKLNDGDSEPPIPLQKKPSLNRKGSSKKAKGKGFTPKASKNNKNNNNNNNNNNQNVFGFKKNKKYEKVKNDDYEDEDEKDGVVIVNGNITSNDEEDDDEEQEYIPHKVNRRPKDDTSDDDDDDDIENEDESQKLLTREQWEALTRQEKKNKNDALMGLGPFSSFKCLNCLSWI